MKKVSLFLILITAITYCCFFYPTDTDSFYVEENDLLLIPEVNNNMELEGTISSRLDDSDDQLNIIKYKMLNGEIKEILYPVDVKYATNNNIVKDKSNILYLSDNANYIYETRDNDILSFFPASLDFGVLTTSKNDYTISIRPETELINSNPRLENNSVVYSNIFSSGIDLIFKPTFNGLKDDIVITEPLSNYEFRFLVDTNGLSINNEGLLFDKDKNIGEYESVVIIDSVGNIIKGDLIIESIEECQKYSITVSAEANMVNSKLIFPIFIDPSLYFYNGTDYYSNQFFTTTDLDSYYFTNGSSLYPKSIIQVGSYGSYYKRSLIKFPGLNTIIANAISQGLYSCNIMLCRAQSYLGETAIYVEAYPATTNWNLLNYYSPSQYLNLFHGYFNFSYVYNNHTKYSVGRSKINIGASPEVFNSIPLTDVMRYPLFSLDNGLLLKLSDENQIMSFYGANTAIASNMPRLSISYATHETEGIISDGIYRLSACNSLTTISGYSLTASTTPTISSTSDTILSVTDYPTSEYDYKSYIRLPNQLFKVTFCDVGYTIRRITDGYYLKCSNNSTLSFSSSDDTYNYTTRWFIIKDGDYYLIVQYFSNYLNVFNLNSGAPSLGMQSFTTGAGILWDFSFYCLDVPYYEQKERNTCGGATSYMLLNWAGVDLTDENDSTIRERAEINGEVSDSRYFNAIQEINSNYYCFNTFSSFYMDPFYNKLKQNINNGFPVMVHINVTSPTDFFPYVVNHYVVVIGTYETSNNTKRIVIMDPHYCASFMTEPDLTGPVQTYAIIDFPYNVFYNYIYSDCAIRNIE